MILVGVDSSEIGRRDYTKYQLSRYEGRGSLHEVEMWVFGKV